MFLINFLNSQLSFITSMYYNTSSIINDQNTNNSNKVTQNMNPSETPSEHSPSSLKDVRKLQQLYEETRTVSTFYSSTQISKYLQAEREGRYHDEHKQMLRLAESEKEELRETLRFLEQELAKSREQNAALVERYEQLQDEVHHSHEQIARQASLSHSQLEEIERLKRELEKYRQNNEATERLRVYQDIISEKEEEIERLRERLDVIHEQEVEKEQAQIKLESLGGELSRKDQVMDTLKAELDEANKKVEELKYKLKSEGAIMLEIEHLKADNAKLVSLLKGTKEYKKFAEYIEDSNGAVRIPTRSKTPGKKRGTEVKRESFEEWVPAEAFKVAQGFKSGSPLTDDIISKLLLDLNRIWREREKRQLDRLKTKYTSELADLRRQAAMRIPFDEVQANKHISRLKSDIRNFHKETKGAAKTAAKEKQKIEVLDETLKVIGNLQRQNAELTEKNTTLLERVQELEQALTGEEYEKQKFMEGAAWMALKLHSEVERYGGQLNELINEYNKRTEEKDLKGEIDALFVSTTQAWLLESVDYAYEKLSTKIKSAASSARYHSEMAGEKFKSVTETVKGDVKSKGSYMDELEERIFEEYNDL
eukprot:TRINITY_DN3014_c0_g1_i1.p1 TRINITY_DN3014_c0_g1~~TRINITY_DN3014_c0_g1_i1.p1  ORF type:complete len:595 (+),score=92.45 TRINITY_DN3014_c0_g1_i1:2346-4130(+)